MEEFYFQKGLKQGDPLSSFLFILVMESLHLSFQRVVDVGMFKGIQLNPSLNLSHMFYADDAVFVGQRCDDNINILTHMLYCFYWASGLRINKSKSKIMGILVADDKVKSAATKLGCLMLNTPFSYLGDGLCEDVSLTPISDRCIWSLEGSEDFSVASTRKAIDDKRLPVVNFKLVD
ncbi:RNA-directed DNA polymerase, eukaryota [Tanacetum coccineum]